MRDGSLLAQISHLIIEIFSLSQIRNGPISPADDLGKGSRLAGSRRCINQNEVVCLNGLLDSVLRSALNRFEGDGVTTLVKRSGNFIIHCIRTP